MMSFLFSTDLPLTFIFTLSPRSRYAFSANGASSLKAWGIAPGLWIESSESAEGATQGTEVNRAFSATVLVSYESLGRRPRLGMITAPLALNRYQGRARGTGRPTSDADSSRFIKPLVT